MSDSNLTHGGGLNPETTESPRDMQSTNGDSIPTQGDLSTLDMSGTTPPKKKDSPRTVNLADVNNAKNMIGAMALRLDKLIEWQRVELEGGREVFALCFPLDKWELTPEGDLSPKVAALGATPNALGVKK